MNDLISRQAAIDFIDAGHLCSPNEPRWSDNDVVNFLKSRPSAEPETCAYWDRESNFCALYRPSAQPKLGELASNLHQAIKFDAVPVIRCGECKYYSGKWCKRNAITDFDLNDVMKSADDYCSQAERKEE